jgi:hypothetical protein
MHAVVWVPRLFVARTMSCILMRLPARDSGWDQCDQAGSEQTGWRTYAHMSPGGQKVTMEPLPPYLLGLKRLPGRCAELP